MLKFWIKVAVYLICFVLSMIGLSAIDYNRFIKQGKVMTGTILYIIIAFALAYLLGQFFMNIIYYFYI